MSAVRYESGCVLSYTQDAKLLRLNAGPRPFPPNPILITCVCGGGAFGLLELEVAHTQALTYTQNMYTAPSPAWVLAR